MFICPMRAHISIHDPETKGNVNKSPTELTPPANAKLPPKPLDRYEECRAKDFYPVTWRVIGGGVMMGGQSESHTVPIPNSS